MTNLRTDHPYLYRRVRLKAIVHTLLGFILIFIPAEASSRSKLEFIQWFGLMNLGIIYLVIGMIIILGLFRPNDTYAIARLGIKLSFIYNLLIFIGLCTVFFQNNTTASFIVLYGYLTHNIFHVLSDPGWKAISLVKKMTDEIEDYNEELEYKHGSNLKTRR